MKAINIDWDTNGNQELKEKLPKEIDISDDLIDEMIYDNDNAFEQAGEYIFWKGKGHNFRCEMAEDGVICHDLKTYKNLIKYREKITKGNPSGIFSSQFEKRIKNDIKSYWQNLSEIPEYKNDIKYKLYDRMLADMMESVVLCDCDDLFDHFTNLQLGILLDSKENIFSHIVDANHGLTVGFHYRDELDLRVVEDNIKKACNKVISKQVVEINKMAEQETVIEPDKYLADGGKTTSKPEDLLKGEDKEKA